MVCINCTGSLDSGINDLEQAAYIEKPQSCPLHIMYHL